jgi:hypothetical protein
MTPGEFAQHMIARGEASHRLSEYFQAEGFSTVQAISVALLFVSAQCTGEEQARQPPSADLQKKIDAVLLDLLTDPAMLGLLLGLLACTIERDRLWITASNDLS